MRKGFLILLSFILFFGCASKETIRPDNTNSTPVSEVELIISYSEAPSVTPMATDAPATVAPTDAPTDTPVPTDTPEPTQPPKPYVAEDGVYTIAWISDPQHYSAKFPELYDSMTLFLRDHREELQLAYIMHTGDLEHVFDYADVDGLLCDVMYSQTLYIADDGSEIILGCGTYSRYSSSSGYKIMHLSRAASNPNAGKTELIVTTNEGFYPERSDFIALQKFNQNNGSFFLKYEFPMEEDGRFKDIDADIYLTYDPSQELSDKNRFMDLAPYLDPGDDHDNGQFFANAIDAAKNGDCIYHVPLDISACGIFTASSNVPQGQTGFTFQSYVEFVDNVCNGVDPMSKTAGYMMGKAENFTRLFMSMSDLFICDGKAHLDNEEMRELMLFVDEYGSDVSLTEEEIYKPIIEEHNEEIQAAVDALEGRTAGIEGRSGAKYGELCSFDDYISFYVMYGQELGFYGLPSFDGRGPMTISHEFVSVSSGSLYPDACVEFVNLLLSYDIQKNMDSNPVNREAFRTAAEEKLSLYNKELDIRRSLGLNVTERIPEDAVGKYTEILNSSKGIANAGGAVEQIVREESSSYFSGGRSMDDVIPVMQKRIQTVLDETA